MIHRKNTPRNYARLKLKKNISFKIPLTLSVVTHCFRSKAWSDAAPKLYMLSDFRNKDTDFGNDNNSNEWAKRGWIKLRDTIRDGIIAGLLGSVGDVLIHAPAYLILGTTMTAHYISQLIFPFKEVNLIRWALGFATHFFVGALAGIALSFIFKYFGRDYAYYKGVGLGIVFWIVHVIVIPNMVEPRPFIFRTELEAVVDLAAHVSYGVAATFYLVFITRKKKVAG